MQIPINKEIRHYQEEIFLGLNLRQMICSGAAIAVAVAVYLGLTPLLGCLLYTSTKIKAVKHHLQRCLDYTSNPNKTEKFADDDLRRLLSYTQNQDKTEHQLYVTGFHCDPETACMSMELTKRLWEQPTDKGVLAYHIIQSFSPGEATPRCV